MKCRHSLETSLLENSPKPLGADRSSPGGVFAGRFCQSTCADIVLRLAVLPGTWQVAVVTVLHTFSEMRENPSLVSSASPLLVGGGERVYFPEVRSAAMLSGS